jgi:hypothetical protein
MSGALPHPNIEPPLGARLDSAALGAIFAEIQRNFDALNGRFPIGGGDLVAKVARAVTGGAKVASGFTEVTFSGGVTSGPVVVTHGLGVIPTAVFAEVDALGTSGTARDEFTKTTFRITAAFGAAHTGNLRVDWLAFG